MHHTDCGLQTVTEDAFKAELEAELGIKPWWALESFVDPYADVAQSMARLASMHTCALAVQGAASHLREVSAVAVSMPVRPAPTTTTSNTS